MKLVGLCGISGSGKTFIIQHIQKTLKENVSVLSLDNYYKPIQFQQKDSNGFENFDLPDGIDIERFLSDMERLRKGESVHQKVYHFNNPDKEEEYMLINPASIMIIEGIFVLHFQSVFSQLDYSIFLNATHDTTLKRRLVRDMVERGIPEKLIHYQWLHHALPGFENYIKIHQHKVNLIIDNEMDNGDALEKITDVLKAMLPGSVV